MESGDKHETQSDAPSEPSDADLEVMDTARAAAGIESEVLLARARSRLLGQQADPTTIGRYKVIDRVGSGGMGVVYAAHDHDLDRKVAIKILRSDLDRGIRGRQRLVREAQALAKLSHPNVVHVYEVGEHNEQLYLAMEFVDGLTLRRWLKSEEPSSDDILRMFIAAGRGLLAAHRAGVIHRDFKPDNVLIGEDGRPRVMDFGLARPGLNTEDLSSDEVDAEEWNVPTDESQTDGSMTLTGTVLGTPAYMDPQQLMGAPGDGCSDQYAFCVSLFESLYGERPYQGSTVTELVRHMGGRVPTGVDARRHGVPSTVQRAILRGLEFDRKDRFPSFGALLEALETSLAAKPRRAWPWVAGVAGLALAGLVVANAGRPQTDADPPAAQQTNSTAAILAASDLPDVVETPLPDDPTRVTVHRLDNGLTVYVAPRPEEPKVSVRVVLRAGSTEEPDDAQGIAELTRRAIDPGGARLGVVDAEAEQPHLQRQHDALEAFAAATSDAERVAFAEQADTAWRKSMPYLAPGDPAFVSSETDASEHHEEFSAGTDWWVAVPSNRLEPWVRMQAELIRNPTFRGFTNSVTRTAENLRYEYEGAEIATQMDRLLVRWNGHSVDPVAQFETFGRLPLAEVREFHETYYRPNNMALVLVGDITPERALTVVEAAFGDWEPGELPPSKLLDDEPWETKRRLAEITSPVGNEVWVGWSLPPTNDGSRPLIDALASALAGPEGLLTTILDHQPGLFDGHLMLLDRGLVVSVRPGEGVPHQQAEDALHGVMKRVADGDIEDEIWEQALIRHPLESVHWSRSTVALSEIIAESYLHHRQWKEVAQTLRPSKVSPRALSELAAKLIERGTGVIHARPGDLTPLPPLRFRFGTPPDPSRRTVRSDFAAQLVAIPASPIEPRFLSDGMHFVRSTWGDAEVVTSNVSGPLFRLSLRFPVGQRDDPFVCSASRMRASQWGVSFTALNRAHVWPECGVEDTTLHIVGLDSDFDALWKETWLRLGDVELDPQLVQREIEFELHYRQEARTDPMAMADALFTYTALGPRSLQRSMPADGQLRRVTPTRLRQTLETLAFATPDVMYAGPSPQRLRASLPSPKQPRVVSPPTDPPAAVEGNLVYVHDLPGADQVDVRVSLAMSVGSPSDEVMQQMVLSQPPPAVREVSTAGGIAYSPAPPPEHAPWRPGLIGWGYRIEHEQFDVLLPKIVTATRAGPDLSEFAHFRLQLQSTYRTQRYAPLDVPRFVRSWPEDGAVDPRLARWTALGRMQPADYTAFIERQQDNALIVTVLADTSRIDLSKLRDVGVVVRVDPSEVLRDIETTDAGGWMHM